MRVLHLIPSFVGGGAERQLALLAPELCRLGLQTHIGFVHPGVNLEQLRHTPVKLHQISCRGNHDPTILLRLLWTVRAIKPHIIQTWLPQMDVFGGLAAKLAGVPFVLSERSSAMAYPASWKNWLRKVVGGQATAIVANSEGGANYWQSRARTGVLQVIRNGLAVDCIRAINSADPAQVGLPPDVRLILFAGRLNPEKNIETFLEALEGILESRPDCSALLFGEGPLRTSVLARIKGMKACARVQLLAFTDELWSWMRRASVFVSLSRFEGNPNTVLEAMAIGCPLVVSNIAAHREILDESMAHLCDGGSVSSVAAAIQSVLENSSAAATRAELACAHASEWSIAEAARQYIQLYKTLVLASHRRT